MQFFITNDRPNVKGLVLAGCADFKNELQQSDLFDPRLQAVVIKVVDVSYGGESGFNQAIELSAEELRNVKFVQEKKLISQFFQEVSLDTQKYAFGIDDTLHALSMGAAETVIVWENLPHTRFTLRTPTGEEIVKYVILKDQKADDYESSDAHLRDPDTGAELEVVDSVPAVEWFAQNYKNFGASLEFITDKS